MCTERFNMSWVWSEITIRPGVASRGKLMGKALPVIDPTPRSALEADIESRSLTPGEQSDPSEEVERS